MKETIDEIVTDIFEGYNNYIDLENKFYEYLNKRLRNEPDKIKFLDDLLNELNISLKQHKKSCPNEKCGKDMNKSVAEKIIKALTKELKEKDITKITTINNTDNSINKGGIINGANINVGHQINSEKKESWFRKNIKYFYYTGGVITMIYGLYEWLIPYLFNKLYE